MSMECECLGCTRGSGVVSSADDVIDMSVVRGVRGVSGVCELCMCLARAGLKVWLRGLSLGFTNPVGTGGVWDMCLCFGCGGVGVCWGIVGGWPGSGMVDDVMSVCVCEAGFFV